MCRDQRVPKCWTRREAQSVPLGQARAAQETPLAGSVTFTTRRDDAARPPQPLSETHLERVFGSEVIHLRLEGGQVNKYTNGELKQSNLLYFYIDTTERTPTLGGWARRT